MSVADVEKVNNTEYPSLSLAEQKLEKERLLVGAVKSLNAPYWFERSCKITKKLHIKKITIKAMPFVSDLPRMGLMGPGEVFIAGHGVIGKA
jgi:hypothetical protein